MTILKDDEDNTLEISYKDTISELELECEKIMYLAELPTIICNNKQLAKQIQEETNLFVNNLSKKLLKNNS